MAFRTREAAVQPGPATTVALGDEPAGEAPPVPSRYGAVRRGEHAYVSVADARDLFRQRNAPEPRS